MWIALQRQLQFNNWSTVTVWLSGLYTDIAVARHLFLSVSLFMCIACITVSLRSNVFFVVTCNQSMPWSLLRHMYLMHGYSERGHLYCRIDGCQDIRSTTDSFKKHIYRRRSEVVTEEEQQKHQLGTMLKKVVMLPLKQWKRQTSAETLLKWWLSLLDGFYCMLFE